MRARRLLFSVALTVAAPHRNRWPALKNGLDGLIYGETQGDPGTASGALAGDWPATRPLGTPAALYLFLAARFQIHPGLLDKPAHLRARKAEPLGGAHDIAALGREGHLDRIRLRRRLLRRRARGLLQIEARSLGQIGVEDRRAITGHQRRGADLRQELPHVPRPGPEQTRLDE